MGGGNVAFGCRISDESETCTAEVRGVCTAHAAQCTCRVLTNVLVYVELSSPIFTNETKTPTVAANITKLATIAASIFFLRVRKVRGSGCAKQKSEH
jgi:hypothetical protein